MSNPDEGVVADHALTESTCPLDGDEAATVKGASVLTVMRSVGVATLLPVLLGVFGAPLLARAMDPSDRGRLAGLLAAATIANAIALGGIPHQLPKDLARLAESDAWAHVTAAVRQLRVGMCATAFALAGISAVIWPGSLTQACLIAVFLALWWIIGIIRAALTGIGDHRWFTISLLIESVGRFVGVLVLVLGWTQVGATLGLLAVGVVPSAVVVLVVTPRMVRMRTAGRRRAAEQVPVAFSGYAVVSVSLTQQLMGRSILSIWAIVLSEDQIGYFAVAFALTELTVNFARVAQPFVIRRAQGGSVNVWPWIAATTATAVLTGVLGPFLVGPLFGDEYSRAAHLVIPLAVAQAMFSVVVFETGVRFVSDAQSMIRGVQSWQAISVVATVGAALTFGSVAVAWVFAALATMQAASAMRANRRAPTTELKAGATMRPLTFRT